MSVGKKTDVRWVGFHPLRLEQLKGASLRWTPNLLVHISLQIQTSLQHRPQSACPNLKQREVL